MRLWAWSAIFMMMVSSNVSTAAVLIENGVSQSRSRTATTGLEFRARKKLGLGVETAGSLGVFGSKVEINFTQLISLGGGFGLGDGYQSYNLFFKRAIGGDSFVPYVAAGFSRWYSVGSSQGGMNSSTPGFFAERFLNDKEKSSGDFAETLIYPAAGIQYYQLSGDWSGASLYAEILLLVDLDDLVSAATGGLGLMYYF